MEEGYAKALLILSKHLVVKAGNSFPEETAEKVKIISSMVAHHWCKQ